MYALDAVRRFVKSQGVAARQAAEIVERAEDYAHGSGQFARYYVQPIMGDAALAEEFLRLAHEDEGYIALNTLGYEMSRATGRTPRFECAA